MSYRYSKKRYSRKITTNSTFDHGAINVLDRIIEADTIQISCVGYRTKKITKVDLENNIDGEIVLESISYSLEEFNVTASKVKYKNSNVGVKTMLDLCQTGFS